MLSEPYKIKEVKKGGALQPYERWNIIKNVGFNTFRVLSDHVAFDMVARGMSAWSHFQKAALMIGDEAYAGARSYFTLLSAVRDVLGVQEIVPAHNGIGAEKLLASVLVQPGQAVLHNRGREQALVQHHGGVPIDLSAEAVRAFRAPDQCGAELDLGRLETELRQRGTQGVAYVCVDLCPEAWGGQPLAAVHLQEVRRLCSEHGVRLAVDISNVLEAAWWSTPIERRPSDLLDVARKMIGSADVVMMDASEDARSDVGGLVAASDPTIHAALRNQVVVFEGLHTYGGMTGRAMDVFAVGVREMAKPEMTEWHQAQLEQLFSMLTEHAVPAYRTAKGIVLDAAAFLPQLGPEDHPKHVLAACLYIQGGIRPRIDGDWPWHSSGPGARFLTLEVPRCAYTRNHLREIADVICSVHARREEIFGLRLANQPEFVDEASFQPVRERLFVTLPRAARSQQRLFEPYKIAIFEPLKVTDKAYRHQAIAEAGYNTFLLRSEDVYIDLLTDSGTSAMSCHQWEGMADTSDTPYNNRHIEELCDTFREVLGFEHVLPTHQGRAAEHIMSQAMIKPGQLVPGNMYFTTTKLHQEMAGGVFVDVIVEAAHDPQNEFPWKGNIDLAKLEAEINRVGGKGVAYVSHECSVNMAGGQPFSMPNLKALSKLCQQHGIPIMFDATRCVENAWMIKLKDPEYAASAVRDILREMMSYGDGCTISCKKDFLVNMGGILACNNPELARRFRRLLRTWEGEITNGGMDTKDIVALTRGFCDSLDDEYIKMRIEQTQELGRKLIEAGVPIVLPPGTHAIFLDARRFLPHVDQEQYPAQALAAALYIETGVRAMERGNVSKGRDPKTGQNYRPKLELVRLTIPRRVYTNSQMDFVVEGIVRLWEKRQRLTGLEFVYEPKVLRFFQSRFKPRSAWTF